MIRILMIDDNEEVCKATRDYCYTAHSISLQYTLNLEDGLKELFEATTAYDAVILDGRGLLKEGDLKATENHVVRGILSIKEKRPFFPIAVYTAFLGIAHDRLEGLPRGNEVRVFEKTSRPPSDLFEYLIESVENHDLYKVRNKYETVIDLFQTGQIVHDEQLLSSFLGLLVKYEKDAFLSLDATARYGAFGTLRAVLEAMYKSLNEHAVHMVPDDMFISGKMNFNRIKKHLSGNRLKNPETARYEPTTKVYQSQDIEYLAQCVYWNAGSNLHFDPDRVGALTNYALISNLFALLEIMMWYKHGWESGLFYS